LLEVEESTAETKIVHEKVEGANRTSDTPLSSHRYRSPDENVWEIGKVT
jgi:hypothetical protein